MEFIKLTEKEYGLWDKFCLESDDAWFWHTSDWIEYNLNYRSEYKPENFSFFVKENGKIVAVCPLILELHGGVKELSYGGYGIPVPALINNFGNKDKNRVLKEIFGYIDLEAEKVLAKKAEFRFSVLSKSFVETKNNTGFNFLQKFGYLDTSINTQIINLEQPLTSIRADFRQDHKYNINKASKVLNLEVFDQSNITEDVYDQYVKLKILLSGQKPRSMNSFNLMYDFIKKGFAFLITAKDGQKFAGFSYFFSYKGNVYYGSACNFPEYKKVSVAHAIQWKAIEWMKEKGFKFYEIGWQNFFQNLSNSYGEKEVSISEFKRGFGGMTLPLFMGEKYYDKDYFLSVYQDRIKKYADFLEQKDKNDLSE